MIQETDAISIGTVIKSTGTSPPSCELLIDGKPIGNPFQGEWLGAAFLCDAGYLVFLIEDYLFHENLNIYFLSFSGDILDTASIFSGSFYNIQVRQPDTILFEFFANGLFKVEIYPKLKFRLPIISDPIVNFSRHFGFKGYLKITEISHKRASKTYPNPTK